MRMKCSLSSAPGPRGSSESLWTLPSCLLPLCLISEGLDALPEGCGESWGRGGLGVRSGRSTVQAGEDGRVRRDPQWGTPGACRGSAAPARGSPAHAPAPPLRCCRSFCHSRSSQTLQLRPPHRRTPRWLWWKCHRTWRSGRRRYGGGQSPGPSAARGSEKTVEHEGRDEGGGNTHRCRTHRAGTCGVNMWTDWH